VYSSLAATTNPRYLIKRKHIHSLRILAGYNTINLSDDAEIFLVFKLSQTLQLVPMIDGYIPSVTGYVDKTLVIATIRDKK
jgi:hypothetical protein